MRLVKTLKTIHVWILTILFVLFYSTKSFSGTDRDKHSKEALKAIPKDCVSCAADEAFGNPLEGNKSAKLIAMASSAAALSQEEVSFYNYLDIYCMNFSQLGGVKNFKKILIDPMTVTAGGNDEIVNRYWQTASCVPRLVGGTKSPLAHLVAENPTDRKSYLVALKRYYNEKNDKETFVKILNAKDSRGQTLLDFMNVLYEKKTYMKQEEKPLNDLYQFLCENGAVASTTQRKCPAEYLSI